MVKNTFDRPNDHGMIRKIHLRKLDSKRNNLYEGDFMIKHLQKLLNRCAKELLKAVRERVFGILSMESVNKDNFVGRGGWRYLWMRYGRDEAGVES